ncbi:MAG: hypothetical protein Q9165_008816 [Trypethelium subeluteriae]
MCYVVRTAPNELAFNSAQSWKDIYGFRQGHQTFIKSQFYDGGSFAGRGVHSIVSEREVEAHGQMRKYLSHAFSDRSLSEQEEIITATISKFVDLAGKRGNGKGGWDIAKAYEMMTFDIIGDLAFGEPFGGLENATDKTHPWIDIAMGALTQGALADMFKRFPRLSAALMPLFKFKIAKLTKDTQANEEFAIELVNRRITRKAAARKDFMTRILEERDPDKVSDLQLAAHASDFVLAGSETTATALSAITYYLLRTPNVMQRLKDEIRAMFLSYNDINAQATQRLPYLRMVVVYTNPVAASLDPMNFTEPELFKPERWLGHSEDVLDAAQPFSLGPRGCLGRNLGWMELRTTLARLLWRYDLELMNDKLDWHRESQMHTLWKKPKLLVAISERKAPKKA